MTSPMFICDTIYHGFRLMQGAQSPATLSALIEAVVKSKESNTSQLNQEKCQLQCDDEKFVISIGAKKDEGFESDCESSGSGSEDPLCPNTEVKVIKDHVLRLEKLIQEDSSSQGFSSACDSSSSLSSGTDSDEESPRLSLKHVSVSTIPGPEGGSAEVLGSPEDAAMQDSLASTDKITNPALVTNVSGDNELPKDKLSSTGATSQPPTQYSTSYTPSMSSAKPQSSSGDLVSSNSSNDHFLVSDILFCHVSVMHPRLVVVVVKAVGTSNIRGHVFECASEEAAKNLYTHYHTASNKYKLDRYRNSKRRVEIGSESFYSIFSKETADNAYTNSLDRKIVTNQCTNQTNSFYNNSLIKNQPDSEKMKQYVSNNNDINLDKENKIKVDPYQFRRSFPNRSLKAHSINCNYNAHLNGSFRSEDNVKVIQIKKSDDISGQHTDEHGITHIEVESQPNSLASNSTSTSDYSSIISLSTPDAGDLIASIGGLPINLPTRLDLYQGELKSQNSSLSSASQNSPSVGGREILVAGEREKKVRQRQPALLLRRDDVTDVSHLNLPKIVDEIPKVPDKSGRSRKERYDENRIIKKEKNKPFVKSINITQDQNNVIKHDYRKTTLDTSSWGHGNRETSRPREKMRDSRERPKRSHNKGPAPPPPPRRHPSNPSLLLVPTKSGQEPTKSFYPKESHIIRGNKIIRTEYPTWTGWTVGADGRYAYYGNPHWIGAHEYHASRGRESNITPEMRRRSRSKSPARRPTGHKYIDAMTTFNFSEKLKDLSDAVFQTKRNIVNTISSSSSSLGVSSTFSGGGTKSHQRTHSTISAPPSCEEGTGLKSVIKKNKKSNPQHDRRVTFSAYATVQVMS